MSSVARVQMAQHKHFYADLFQIGLSWQRDEYLPHHARRIGRSQDASERR